MPCLFCTPFCRNVQSGLFCLLLGPALTTSKYFPKSKMFLPEKGARVINGYANFLYGVLTKQQGRDCLTMMLEAVLQSASVLSVLCLTVNKGVYRSVAVIFAYASPVLAVTISMGAAESKLAEYMQTIFLRWSSRLPSRYLHCSTSIVSPSKEDA